MVMLLLKSEFLDLLTDHLCLFECDLATLRFTFASRPLETALGFTVQGELSGKLVEATFPGLLGTDYVATPVVKQVEVPGVGSILLMPRATTAGRVVVGMVSASGGTVKGGGVP